LTPIPKALRATLNQAGLRFEAMATGPALRVYNVMQSEGPPGCGGVDRRAVTARRSRRAPTLRFADATEHCAGPRPANHARDQWLGALYASAGRTGALCSPLGELRQTKIRQAGQAGAPRS